MVYCSAVNMPYRDDYTFLVDVIHLKAMPITIQSLVDILLVPHGPHNEHMIVFARLSAILDYLIEGELNFRTLFFVGNMMLIATVLLLHHIARRAGLKGVQIVPIALLLFQPQYYESTTTWAICALQHVPALLFAFLAFYLLSRPSTLLFILSIPMAWLAAFSNGNGLAVLMAGFLMLLVAGQRRRLAIWLMFSVVSFLMYYQYTHAHQSSSALGNLIHPLRVLGGFFVLSGSLGVLFTRSLVWIGVLGLGSTLVSLSVVGTLLIRLTGFSHWLKRLPPVLQQFVIKWSVPGSQTGSIPLIACYFYLIITILGIAFARSLGWHYGLLSPRFIWFTTVLVAVGYLLTMIWLRPVYRVRTGHVVLLFSLYFNLHSYWLNLDEIVTIRKSLISDLHNWRENELLITMPSDEKTFDRYYGVILREAIQKGIYSLPKAEFESAVASPSILIDNHLRLVEKDSIFSYVERQHDELTLASNALPPISTGMNGAYLLLQSTQHTFVWPVDQSAGKLARFLLNGKPIVSANVATIFMDMLPEASYRVGRLYKPNGQWQATYSNTVIKVEPTTSPALGVLPNRLSALTVPQFH